MDAGIRAVSHGPRDLARPADTPSDQHWMYGIATPFQLSGAQAALFVNIRYGGAPVDDLEVGSDLVVIDQLDRPEDWQFQPLNRSEFVDHPRSGQKLRLSKYPFRGGFVPLGARRSDGSPHPHAGTGFGLSTVIGFPADHSVRWVGHMNDPLHYLELHQHAYDGRQFHVLQIQRLDPGEWITGWHMVDGSLSNGIVDGDDLICGMVGGHINEPPGAGLGRWQRTRGAWSLVDYSPVTGADLSTEPSVIRDADGSLLFTARGCYSHRVPLGQSDHSQSIRVWRSVDGGRHWTLIIHMPQVRPASPLTLNRALDGTPYVIYNPHGPAGMDPQRAGPKREWLAMRALAPDRRRLLEPMLVRDGPSEFGPPPADSQWCLDHAMGCTLRLRDGLWRHVLAHRVMEAAESAGAMPTAITGCYLEELISSGPTVPAWCF